MDDNDMPPDETVEALKQQHGEVHLIGNEHGQAIFRLPNAREYQRLIDEVGNQQLKGAATKTLVMACVVWPAMAAFKDLVERKPGLVQVFGGELVELAGAKAATTVKKL